jgi:hypothetical protein
MAFYSRPRLCLCLALGVALSALSALPAQTSKTGAAKADAGAKDKDKGKAGKGDARSVSFRTSDGVELKGSFYPAPASGAKEICVLLLKNFNARNGADTNQGDYENLATALQKEGYAVLTFDFRGFGVGYNTPVDKEFWNRAKNPHNQRLRNAAKMPETINRSEFPVDYFPNLVNDVAAAKAYLDRKNDGREVNASNLVVIGAGEGATLGALWLASEAHRKKDRASLTPGMAPDLDQAELRDVCCAVWLSISPTLASRAVPVRGWLTEVGRDLKVPMAFIYGKKDDKQKNFVPNLLSAIKPKTGPKKFDPKDPKDENDPRHFTGEKVLDTPLAGSQLLQKSLDTQRWIVNDYLKDFFGPPRTIREWRKRDAERYAYVWAFPTSRIPMLAKAPGEEAPRPLPLQMFFRAP